MYRWKICGVNMRRFFTHLDITEDRAIIGSDTAHHIANVLRLGIGEEIEVVWQEKIYTLKITGVSKKDVTTQIVSVVEIEQETKIEVVLYQGLPKGEKLEWVIQKATELGVAKIVPLVTERAIVKLDEAKSNKKVLRWQKIADEASEQSKRMISPTITNVMKWQDFLTEITEENTLTIVLWEDEKTVGLKEILTKNSNVKKINLLIGPEGGLTESEVKCACEKGAVKASLGKRILRTETAAIASVAIVLYQYNEIG